MQRAKRKHINELSICAKLIGDELMGYAMSLLVLPYLMDMTKNSPEYNEWKENKHKRLN